MRNPLIKRLPKELKGDFAKYTVLFVFLTIMISFISGFLVASESMRLAYDESFEKYNIEDGNFELMFQAEEQVIETLKAEGVTIYENFYLDKEIEETDGVLRIFKNREDVNLVCIMEGELPKTSDEIAIDRMNAWANHISIGDELEIGGETLLVTGLVALSDYSALYSSNADMMFDAQRFGVAVMTEEGFEALDEGGLHYSYSWIYDKAPVDEAEEKDKAETFMEVIAENGIVMNYLPQYTNQAINFTGTDMGRDNMVFTVFLYIVMAIIAFVFAITTTNTIAKEANVIGTLRASGYTRGEMLRHYLAMPVLVTLTAALIGNVLGYTYFEDVAAGIYYQSYSLPTYVTVWNMNAFIKTTVIPVILMIVINYLILVKKLKLSPLKFIRRDLSTRQKKKAFRLNTKLPIMVRFRLRIIFQNMPNYIMIFIGIFFANVVLLLGIAFPALLNKYQEDIAAHMLAEYQYVLRVPMETDEEAAEKFSMGTLQTIEGELKSEQVTLMGIAPDSAYIDLEFEDDKVYVSSSYAQKFGISMGDTITLKEEYGNKEYSFKVAGEYYYPAGVTVFMEQSYFNEVFEQETDYYNGYLSSEEITDIEDIYMLTKITEDDLTKTSRQLTHSLGSMMNYIMIFGVVMYTMIIFLLTKIIIEKNAQSISMTKILGYTNGEISGLYVMATTIVVIAALILTIPLADRLMEYVCIIMLSEYPGWIPYYVPANAYCKMTALGVVSYALIATLQYGKVKKIPMDMALKNVE